MSNAETGPVSGGTERLREALESIAKNTCCEGCGEAAKVARAALADSPGAVTDARRRDTSEETQMGRKSSALESSIHVSAREEVNEPSKQRTPSFVHAEMGQEECEVGNADGPKETLEAGLLCREVTNSPSEITREMCGLERSSPSDKERDADSAGTVQRMRTIVQNTGASRRLSEEAGSDMAVPSLPLEGDQSRGTESSTGRPDVIPESAALAPSSPIPDAKPISTWIQAQSLNEHNWPAPALSSGAGAHDYFASNNTNIRNAQQFHDDVEFIHAAHIEGGIEVACRQVFDRRQREAFEAGLHAQAERTLADSPQAHIAECRCLSCMAGLVPKEAFSRTQQSPESAASAPSSEAGALREWLDERMKAARHNSGVQQRNHDLMKAQYWIGAYDAFQWTQAMIGLSGVTKRNWETDGPALGRRITELERTLAEMPPAGQGAFHIEAEIAYRLNLKPTDDRYPAALALVQDALAARREPSASGDIPKSQRTGTPTRG